jgi:hypothetical protein
MKLDVHRDRLTLFSHLATLTDLLRFLHEQAFAGEKHLTIDLKGRQLGNSTSKPLTPLVIPSGVDLATSVGSLRNPPNINLYVRAGVQLYLREVTITGPGKPNLGLVHISGQGA